MAVFLFYALLFGGYGWMLWQAARFWPVGKSRGQTSAGPNFGNPGTVFWIVSLAVLVLIVGFVSQERWVRSHDHAGYYQGCVYVARELLPKLFREGRWYLRGTIEHEEYNALLCFLVAPGLRVAGVDIPTYTAWLGMLGLLPFSYLILAFVRRQAVAMGAGPLAGYAAGLLGLMLPAVYLPLLQGMADIAVLPVATLALLAALRIVSLAESGIQPMKLPASLLLAVGGSLFVLPILRRYFGIYAVAWFPAVGLTFAVSAFSGRMAWRQVWGYGFVLAGMGTAVGLAWYFLFPQFFHALFIKQYADVYQAYRAGSLGLDIFYLWTQYGALAWGLALAGVLSFALKPATRMVGFLLASHLVITVAGVLRIQSFSPQHYYLVAPALALLAGAGVLLPNTIRFKGGMGGKTMRAIVSAGLAALLALCGLIPTLAGSHLPFHNALIPLASQIILVPPIRTDMQQLRAIAADLAALNPKGNKLVYVAGSSTQFNDDIFRNLAMPDYSPGLKGLLWPKFHAHVDRRDSFPAKFLTADFVVLPVPMQYHLRPEDQQLAAWVQRTVINSAGLGRCFRLLESYPMEGGYNARLYERMATLPRAEVQRSLVPLAAQYPSFPGMYALPPPDRTEVLASSLGDSPYATAEVISNGDTLAFHPGKTTASSLTVLFPDGGYIHLKPRFFNPCPDGGAVTLVLVMNGVVADSIVVDHLALPMPKPILVPAMQPLEIRVYPMPRADYCDRVLFGYSITKTP